MKILQIGSALHDWGGIERYLLYAADSLAGRGHEVWATVPPGSPLDTRLTCRKVPIGLRRQFQWTSVAPYLRLFKRERFDAVNVHFSPDYIVPAVAARIAKQQNLILTRHVVLPWKPYKVRRYTRLWEHFFCVSDAVRKELARSGVPEALMQVPKAGCPALEPGSVLARPGVFGFFGRLAPEKGIDVAARASYLAEVRLEVYGNGKNLDLFRSSFPYPSVEFKGRVEDVADAMASVAAVVVPSVWEEAFPYSVLEAFSIGKPVLASISGGLPEMVEDGVTGFLHPKRDEKKLAEDMKRIMDDPDLCSKMGHQARELHRTEYTLEKMGERLEHAYTNVLAREPTPFPR
ncbi:MAG TPA: glycosyltransferase [Fimbriimonadaceae bacterium]|nr:glycosyltransferase [Fimbriimonadaceae bacterium]